MKKFILLSSLNFLLMNNTYAEISFVDEKETKIESAKEIKEKDIKKDNVEFKSDKKEKDNKATNVNIDDKDPLKDFIDNKNKILNAQENKEPKEIKVEVDEKPSIVFIGDDKADSKSKELKETKKKSDKVEIVDVNKDEEEVIAASEPEKIVLSEDYEKYVYKEGNYQITLQDYNYPVEKKKEATKNTKDVENVQTSSIILLIISVLGFMSVLYCMIFKKLFKRIFSKKKSQITN